jgi:hypothetical protein
MSTEDLGSSLPARDLGGILNETFVVYGRHFRQFAGLAAVVQVPATLLGLIPSEGLAVFVALNIVSLFALVAIYGAVISGVGQHYVTGDVTIGRCYARVVWRMVSMIVLVTILAALTAAGIVSIDIQTPLLISLAFLAVLAAYLVYVAVAAPVVIVEGYQSLGALRRSYGLVRRSEWRILGNLAVYLLVAGGLSFVLFLPFWLVSIGAAPAATTLVSQGVQTIGSVIVGVVVPPVIFIAVTLLYYDLRVRNENYDVVRLSQEMGLMAA